MSLVYETFHIEGKVISKDNARHFNKYGRSYLPKKFKDYENNVAMQVKPQVRKIYSCDIVVYTDFYMKNKKHCDLCNLTKSLYDSLNGILWVDDRQIKECALRVIYNKLALEGARITVLKKDNI